MFRQACSLASSLLLSSAFLFTVAPSTSFVSAAPEPSVIAASDPNFVYAAVQPGTGGFQWYTGITSTGNAANTYTVSFRTLGDVSVVDYVDVKYIINPQQNQNVKSFRMTNSTVDDFEKTPIILLPSDTLAFNFTYLSTATKTQFDTFAYAFVPSTKEIQMTTNIVVPVPGALVTSPQYSVDGFNWKVGVQTYTNLPNQVTVEFIADNYVSINWANLHYVIGNGGSLQNFLMNQNTTQQPNSQVIYSQEVTQLPTGEMLKFNFTFWDVQDQQAEDTQAFVYSQSAQTLSLIDNIASNVDSNSNSNPISTSSGSTTSTSGTGSGTNTGSSSSSSSSSSTNTNTNSNTNTQASDPCAGSAAGTCTYVNTPAKNGAVGMMKSGMGVVAALATVAAAVMAVL